MTCSHCGNFIRYPSATPGVRLACERILTHSQDVPRLAFLLGMGLLGSGSVPASILRRCITVELRQRDKKADLRRVRHDWTTLNQQPQSISRSPDHLSLTAAFSPVTPKHYCASEEILKAGEKNFCPDIITRPFAKLRVGTGYNEEGSLSGQFNLGGRMCASSALPCKSAKLNRRSVCRSSDRPAHSI
jgi:hypothetical protein